VRCGRAKESACTYRLGSALHFLSFLSVLDEFSCPCTSSARGRSERYILLVIMDDSYVGLLQLPVEVSTWASSPSPTVCRTLTFVQILYEIELLALSESLPVTCQRLRDVYENAPVSFRVEYLLARCEVAHLHNADARLLNRALRFPICNTDVLSLLLRRLPPLPAHPKPELPRRLFRVLEPRAPTRPPWRPGDAPLPFLRALYGAAAPDTNAHDGYALSRAVYAGHGPLIRFLLAHGAEPARKDAFAVHVAIRRRDLPLVRTLLEPDYTPPPPPTVPTKRRREREEEEAKSPAAPGKRRRVEDRMPVDKRMLHAAMQAGSDELVQYFLDKGCVPDMKTLLMGSSAPTRPLTALPTRRARPGTWLFSPFCACRLTWPGKQGLTADDDWCLAELPALPCFRDFGALIGHAQRCGLAVYLIRECFLVALAGIS
jgi:hypothetical protein